MKIRASDMANGADQRTHYLAVVSDERFPDFMGCSNIPYYEADPSAIAVMPAGKFRSDWAWDTDGSYADWYAGHELGHTLGRRHLGACGDLPEDDDYPYKIGAINTDTTDYVGWDIGLSTSHGDGRTHDVMSYCSDLWPSNYTYTRLYNRLIDESTIQAKPVLPPPIPAAQWNAISQVAALADPPQEASVVTRDTTRWARVLAVVDVACRSGEIQALVDGIPGATRSLAVPDSLKLRLRDAAGLVLDSFPVRIRDASGPIAKGSLISVIQEDIVVDARTAAVELVLYDVVLDRLVVSRSAPKISRIRVSTQDTDNRRPLVFTWDAVDADTMDALTYTVLVWFDNEEVPETLAAGLQKRRIEIDSTQRRGRSVTRIEIVASDGVRISRIQSSLLP